MSTYKNGPGNVPRIPARVVDTLIDSAGVSRCAPGRTPTTVSDQTAAVERLVHDACEELLARLPNTPTVGEASAAASNAVGRSLFERKLADLEQRGHEVIGHILHKDGEYALFDGSYRWLKRAHYQRLMHEHDGSLFADKPAAAAPRARRAGSWQERYEADREYWGHSDRGREESMLAEIADLRAQLSRCQSAQGASELPPLPESEANGDNTTDYFGHMFEYTADQMRQYARDYAAQLALAGQCGARQEPVAHAWFHRGMVNFDSEDTLSKLDDGKGTPIRLYASPVSAQGAPKSDAKRMESDGAQPEADCHQTCGHIGAECDFPHCKQEAQQNDERAAALEEAAQACEAWGNEKVAKWADDPEMLEDAKARAWDSIQCANAIRKLAAAPAQTQNGESKGKAASLSQGAGEDKAQRQIEWSHDLQSRLIEVGKDQELDVRNIMAEAACLLAYITGRAAHQDSTQAASGSDVGGGV